MFAPYEKTDFNNIFGAEYLRAYVQGNRVSVSLHVVLVLDPKFLYNGIGVRLREGTARTIAALQGSNAPCGEAQRQ